MWAEAPWARGRRRDAGLRRGRHASRSRGRWRGGTNPGSTHTVSIRWPGRPDRARHGDDGGDRRGGCRAARDRHGAGCHLDRRPHLQRRRAPRPQRRSTPPSSGSSTLTDPRDARPAAGRQQLVGVRRAGLQPRVPAGRPGAPGRGDRAGLRGGQLRAGSVDQRQPGELPRRHRRRRGRRSRRRRPGLEPRPVRVRRASTTSRRSSPRACRCGQRTYSVAASLRDLNRRAARHWGDRPAPRAHPTVASPRSPPRGVRDLARPVSTTATARGVGRPDRRTSSRRSTPTPTPTPMPTPTPVPAPTPCRPDPYADAYADPCADACAHADADSDAHADSAACPDKPAAPCRVHRAAHGPGPRERLRMVGGDDYEPRRRGAVGTTWALPAGASGKLQLYAGNPLLGHPDPVKLAPPSRALASATGTGAGLVLTVPEPTGGRVYTAYLLCVLGGRRTSRAPSRPCDRHVPSGLTPARQHGPVVLGPLGSRPPIADPFADPPGSDGDLTGSPRAGAGSRRAWPQPSAPQNVPSRVASPPPSSPEPGHSARRHHTLTAVFTPDRRPHARPHPSPSRALEPSRVVVAGRSRRRRRRRTCHRAAARRHPGSGRGREARRRRRRVGCVSRFPDARR